MTPAEAVVEMAGIVVQAKRDLVTEDEVRSRAEQTRTWDDAKRFLWALRCRAALVRIGSEALSTGGGTGAMPMPSEGEEMRDIIDRACRERGWSHAKLAGVAGLSTVGLWRALKKGNCYISTLARICEALNLDLSEFDLRAIPGIRWTAKSEIAKSAQWLARLRGWTDLDLAEHAGLTVGQIQAFMRGVVSPPTTIAAIEAALGEKLDGQLYQSRAWRTYYERHNREEAT